MIAKTRLFLALPVIALIAFGCSKSRTPCSVSGIVKHKGELVGGGTISFYPKIEEFSGGYGFTIKPDGTYEGSSLPAGEYLVSVETESANKDKKTPTYGPAGGGGKGQSPSGYADKMRQMGKAPQSTEAQGKYVKIPDKYNDKAKSGLTAKLINGKNKVDFDLP